VEAVVDDLVNKVNILSNNNALSTDKDTGVSFKQTEASMQSLCQQFSHFQEEVTARIDQLNSVCVKLSESTIVSIAKHLMLTPLIGRLTYCCVESKKTRMLTCGSKTYLMF